MLILVAPAQTAARERTQEVEMLGTMELFMWKYRGLTVDKLGLPEGKPKIDVEDESFADDFPSNTRVFRIYVSLPWDKRNYDSNSIHFVLLWMGLAIHLGGSHVCFF